MQKMGVKGTLIFILRERSVWGQISNHAGSAARYSVLRFTRDDNSGWMVFPQSVKKLCLWGMQWTGGFFKLDVTVYCNNIKIL